MATRRLYHSAHSTYSTNKKYYLASSIITVFNFSFTGLINEKVLNSCKKGVKVVNVARGGIINEVDLLAALESGQCGGAGLDVYEQEPPTNDVTWALIKHPKVVATPHLGASTAEAQVRVAIEVAEQFVALTGKNQSYKVTGVVNQEVYQNA